jgi:hypothetical protein
VPADDAVIRRVFLDGLGDVSERDIAEIIGDGGRYEHEAAQWLASSHVRKSPAASARSDPPR